MKKITIVLLGMFAIVNLQAQNYYIDFTASGTTTTLDSVFVQNLTQGTSLTLGGSDTLHLIGTVDITDKSQNREDIKIYPNPFNEKSYLEFYNENQTMITIDIYDVVGKNVLSFRQEMVRGMHLFEMTGFATGHYQLIVKADTWQKTAAFVSLNTETTNPKIQHRSSISNEMQVKSISKSAKNTISMPYTTGDEMRLIGFSGLLSEIVNDVPTSSKTIDFAYSASSCGAIYTDIRDGNQYASVLIGSQCWMAKNLAYLPEITFEDDWGSYTEPQYSVYGYEPGSGTETVAGAKATENYNNYGVLYNWEASLTACPPDWHLPSDDEWTDLVDHVVSQGFPNVSGNPNGTGSALKSCRQVDSPLGGNCDTSEHPRWNSHSTHSGFDEFGFSALPGGNRSSNGQFGILAGSGESGLWWSATEDNISNAWGRSLNYNSGSVFRFNVGGKRDAISVRCLRD